jgi:hypothetical protein
MISAKETHQTHNCVFSLCAFFSGVFSASARRAASGELATSDFPSRWATPQTALSKNYRSVMNPIKFECPHCHEVIVGDEL